MTNSDNKKAPPEVIQAVIALALVCAKHKYLTAKGLGMAEIVAKQQGIIKKQREIIARLEARLGIDNEL